MTVSPGYFIWELLSDKLKLLWQKQVGRIYHTVVYCTCLYNYLYQFFTKRWKTIKIILPLFLSLSLCLSPGVIHKTPVIHKHLFNVCRLGLVAFQNLYLSSFIFLMENYKPYPSLYSTFIYLPP